MTAPDFSVVGGGIAGLVVARRLAAAGRTVVLHEAGDRVGGTIAAHTVAGIELDAGAESFATRAGTVAELARGLGEEVVEPSPAPAWLYPVTGRAVPLPATSLLGVPARPLAADVIAAVGLPTALRAALDAVLPPTPIAETTTLGSLVRARMGRGVLDRLVSPVVHGVHSLDPAALPLDRAALRLRTELARRRSLGAAVAAIRAASPPGSAVAGIRGGIHRLVTALAEDLNQLGVVVRLGDRINRLDGLGGEVVIAAPGLVGASSAGRRIVLVTLVVEQPALDAAPRGTGLLVADGAPGIRARALTHSTAKWDWLRERAGGRHVLRLSYDTEPADLTEVARADAAQVLGVELSASGVIGFARTAWTRPAPLDTPTGITVVGETVAGSGLAGIIAHAEAQAERLLV